MMILKIRAVLDVKKDVIRTFLIRENETLEVFHSVVKETFGFENNELSSVYTTDEHWKKTGDEIPLFEGMSSSGDASAKTMETVQLKELLQKVNDKLIYTYDFSILHRFYVTCLEKQNEGLSENETYKTLLSFGKVPAEKPIVENTNENFYNEEELAAILNEDEFDTDAPEFEPLPEEY